MAFSKKKVDDRKDWLKNFQPGTFLDNSADTISYSDFVHKVAGSCISWCYFRCLLVLKQARARQSWFSKLVLTPSVLSVLELAGCFR